MARPKNSKSPVADTSDKYVAATLGSGLSHCRDILTLIRRFCFFGTKLDEVGGMGGLAKIEFAQTQADFERLCVEALSKGDHQFFSDVGKIIELLKQQRASLPVDRFLLILHGGGLFANGIVPPESGYSAREVFEMLPKVKIPCKDIKSVREAAQRVGIKLRAESPGRKPQSPK